MGSILPIPPDKIGYLVCKFTSTFTFNILTFLGVIIAFILIYKAYSSPKKLLLGIAIIFTIIITLMATVSVNTCARNGGVFFKFQPLPTQLTRLLPSPTPTPPPYSQSYSLCQTDICKKILKNQDTARVIVGVKLPRPTPVNWLQDPKLEQQYKQDVSQAISQVLQQLKPETQKSVIPFDFIPFFALTADQQTLDFLATHPQVTSIEEDKLSQPSVIF